MNRNPGTLLLLAAMTLPLFDAVHAWAGPSVAAARAITNTRGGRNEQAVVDKRGKAVLFVSNAGANTCGCFNRKFPHVTRTTTLPATLYILTTELNTHLVLSASRYANR